MTHRLFRLGGIAALAAVPALALGGSLALGLPGTRALAQSAPMAMPGQEMTPSHAMGLGTGMGMGMGMAPGHGMEALAILRGLNLSAVQKLQIAKIIHGSWHAQAAASAKLHDLHAQIADRLLTAGTTKADLAPLLAQAKALHDGMADARLTTMLAIRDVLTPAQLSEAAAKHKQLAALHAQERAILGEGAGAP